MYANFRGVLAKLRLAKPLQIYNAPKRIMEDMTRMSEMKKKQAQLGNGDVKVNGNGDVKVNGDFNGNGDVKVNGAM